jgi:hypothetical protein
MVRLPISIFRFHLALLRVFREAFPLEHLQPGEPRDFIERTFIYLVIKCGHFRA